MTETDENHEIMNKAFKSISGKELPVSWPEIDSFEEYRQKVNELSAGQEGWDTINGLSVKIEHPSGKKLDYLAVAHSQRPKHPQFAQIEERFNQMDPDIVLYEGPESHSVFTNDVTKDEVIARGGEVGYIQWLAHQKGIETRSLDIQYDDWIKGFLQLGYSNEEIATYNVARIYYARAEHMRKDGWKLEEISDEGNFDEQILRDLDKLPRADGQVWSFDLINQEYKKITGQNLSLATNNALNADGSYVALMRKMFTDEDAFREVYMVNEIADTLRTHDRVFAAAGSKHPAVQKKALEQFMEVAVE